MCDTPFVEDGCAGTNGVVRYPALPDSNPPRQNRLRFGDLMEGRHGDVKRLPSLPGLDRRRLRERDDPGGAHRLDGERNEVGGDRPLQRCGDERLVE